MPLRRFYARLGAQHPVAYSNLTLALGMVACMAIACWVSVSVAIHGQEVARQQQQHAADIARKQQQAAACVVAARMQDVYSDPDSDTGRKARVAWQDLQRTFRCDGTEEAPHK